MDDLHRQQHDDDDHHEHDQRAVARPVGIDGRQQQPVAHAGARGPADQQRVHGLERAHHGHGEHAQQHAAGGEPDQRGALQPAGVLRVGEVGLARTAEEDHAVELDHHVPGQRGGQHQHRGCERHQHVDERLRQARREQEHLQQQPLRHEAVERRQPGAGEHADQSEPRDPRHPVDQAAELAEAALVRRVQDGPGGEEQQALEERMIEHVIEHRSKRDRGELRLAVGGEQHGEAESRHDDADVLDRRVGKQALHVRLHGGEHHAEQRGAKPERQRGDAPPPDLHVQTDRRSRATGRRSRS